MKNVAVIMAGGKGERFWPSSISSCPKQFLPLIDPKKTMIELTVERILPLVEMEDIYIVTNEEYVELVSSQCPKIPKQNILLEPMGRNTAPCIAYAGAVIKKKYGDANVIVLASDHLIHNNILFLDHLKEAISLLESDNIITLGIVPTRIETGYGYIQMASKYKGMAYKVKQFVEKPNYETAKTYFESNQYLWNSGMFIFRNSYMETCIKTYLPTVSKDFERISSAFGTEQFYKTVKEVYSNTTSISIDYAIMEKVKNMLVIPSDFGWDDVGSWLAIERYKEKDEQNNVIEGNVLNINGEDNVIINDNNEFFIGCVGVENLIIVKHNNALLVMNKAATSDIKLLIEDMKKHDNMRPFL